MDYSEKDDYEENNFSDWLGRQPRWLQRFVGKSAASLVKTILSNARDINIDGLLSGKKSGGDEFQDAFEDEDPIEDDFFVMSAEAREIEESTEREMREAEESFSDQDYYEEQEG